MFTGKGGGPAMSSLLLTTSWNSSVACGGERGSGNGGAPVSSSLLLLLKMFISDDGGGGGGGCWLPIPKIRASSCRSQPISYIRATSMAIATANIIHMHLSVQMQYNLFLCRK
jgi:hypothetical protein